MIRKEDIHCACERCWDVPPRSPWRAAHFPSGSQLCPSPEITCSWQKLSWPKPWLLCVSLHPMAGLCGVTMAWPPSLSWENSKGGAIPAPELPVGLVGTSVAIALRFNLLLCPILLFSPLIGVVMVRAPQKPFCKTNYNSISQRLNLENENVGTKHLSYWRWFDRDKFIEEIKSSQLGFQASRCPLIHILLPLAVLGTRPTQNERLQLGTGPLALVLYCCCGPEERLSVLVSHSYHTNYHKLGGLKLLCNSSGG